MCTLSVKQRAICLRLVFAAGSDEPGDHGVLRPHPKAEPTGARAPQSRTPGRHPGRTRPDEFTIFKSLGLAVEDLAAAELAIQNAERADIGTSISW